MSALRWNPATLVSLLLLPLLTPAATAGGVGVQADERGGAEAAAAELAARVARHGGFAASEAELLADVSAHACFACHGGASEAQRAALDERGAPRLAAPAHVGERVDAAWLRAFLADPRGTRPHTTHPHELAALDEATRAEVAADLTAFLVAGAAPDTAPSSSSAAELERGRRLFHTVGCVACHVPEEPMEDLAWTLADWRRFEAEDAAAGETGEPVEQPVEDGSSPTFVPPGTLAPGAQPIPADLAAKYSRASLGAFLADPLAVRPSGHMPDLALGAEDARAIAAYLLRDTASGAAGALVETPGLLLTAETHAVSKSAATPNDLPAAATTATRAVAGIDIAHRPAEDEFTLRYEGILTTPVEGEYTFHVRSDDGAWLDVDGVRLIDNGGDHAPSSKSARVTLTAGAHTFGFIMYEHQGGEEVELEWQPPGGERGPIPAEAFTHWAVEFRGLPALVPGDAAAGARAFAALGCAACHTDVAVPQGEGVVLPRPVICVAFRDGFPDVTAPAARLELAWDFVSRQGADTGAPVVAGGSLAALPRLGDRLTALADSPLARTEHVLAQRSCLQCHRRGDVGGVHPERKPYFVGDERAELGDEGRYPPHLTAVGRKLRDDALLAALAAETRARPYTATRMPRFGLANVGSLAGDLAAADRPLIDGRPEADAPPRVPPNAIQLGRRLAGNVEGLGCVQCHDFLGSPSLGVRAVDFGVMHERIRWPWFRDLLLNPTAVNMNTRMTAVFIDGRSPVTDVYGGDPEQQVAALWTFLAEGDQMAPPPGIRTGDAAYEVEPLDRVRMIGVFMRDVSPKVLCVGTPEGVHFAWDMQNARLAKVWRGRFLNARGTWEGRAGALESPPSNDVLDMPPGPVIASFASEAERRSGAWPMASAKSERRTVVDGLPRFEYTVGALEVVDVPAVGSGPDSVGSFKRSVSLVRAPGPNEFVAVRLARAAVIEPAGPGRWQIGGERPILIEVLPTDGVPPSSPIAWIVPVDGALELRAAPDNASVHWSLQW